MRESHCNHYKINNVLLRNRLEREIEKILIQNQKCFKRIRSKTSQILTIRPFLGVRASNSKETLLSIDFSKAFDSINRGKMEQILLAHVRSPDGGRRL